MAETGRVSEDRSVLYQTSIHDGSSYRTAEWPSSEIGTIKNRELRLALQLADIVQVLGFDYPLYGGFPGKVRVVDYDPRQPVAVYHSFPEDTIDRLKDYLNENN